jgi:hypothetical protein
MSRVQDWDDIGLGFWIFISPWVVGFASDIPAAAWTAWVIGGAVLLLGCAAVYMPRLWEEPLNMLLGLSLMLSPWVLGFSERIYVAPLLSVAGLLVTGLAVWAFATDAQFQIWWRAHHHAGPQA